MSLASQNGSTMPGNGPNGTRFTRKEKQLLTVLKQSPGQCLPRALLLRTVWGYREGVKSRTLDVHIQRLRRKLGPLEGGRILTIFRAGYLWSGYNERMTIHPDGEVRQSGQANAPRL